MIRVGESLGIEARAGLTTFLVMAYIIFLNGNIIAGPLKLDPVAVAAGTALIAGVMTIAMGVVGNYPFALAAGLGINVNWVFLITFGVGSGLAAGPECRGLRGRRTVVSDDHAACVVVLGHAPSMTHITGFAPGRTGPSQGDQGPVLLLRWPNPARRAAPHLAAPVLAAAA